MNNQNFFSQEGIPVAPALTREQMVLGLLQDAVADLNKANRALEVSECSNAELRRENFDLWLTAIERDQLAAKCNQLAAELQNRDADHAWRINEANCVNLAQELTINDLQGKLDKCMSEIESLKQSLHMATNMPAISTIDNTSDLEELTDTTLLISTDDDSSDVTDIAINAPTDVDSAVTMPVITSPVVPTPDSAYRLGLCLPPFCRMVNARQGLPGVIYDQSGAEVTSKRLLAVVKPFIFIDLNLMRDIYYTMYSYRLISDDIGPYQLVQTLAILDGFKQWSPQLTSADSDMPTGLTFLWRCDDEPGVSRRNILKRLGLADNIMAAIPGPLLCCTLVTLCGMRMNQLTGDILDQIFKAATGVGLHSLWVTTKRGMKQMSANELCTMMKVWVKNVCKFIAKDDGKGMKRSFAMATPCFGEYSSTSSASRSGGSGCVASGSVADEAFNSNEHDSQLFQGIFAIELEALYGRLFYLVRRDVDERIVEFLKWVAGELQQRPCSP